MKKATDHEWHTHRIPRETNRLACKASRYARAGLAILVRFLLGLVVFLPEGIQKLAFPDMLGAGRFANIGIPYPELIGPFVGIVEIICGILIILGLLTRLAAIPLIVIMVVAIVSTKVPIVPGMISGFSTCPSCRATVSGA